MSCLTAIDAGDALNAFVHKTPEIALDQARAADARLKAGDAPAMCGIPLGIKDLFCTKGVPARRPRTSCAASGPNMNPPSPEAVRCRRGDAGQAEHGRIRHGLVQRDLVLWQCGQPLEGSMTAADAGRVFGRLGRGGGRRPVPCGDRHRHRRLDPPARGLYRHRRHQADLWPRVSRWGIVAFASSLDQAGPMTKTVRDAAIMLRRWRGMTQRIRPAPICRCPISRPR
jgi:aspartyl-tRNA(Asn)/glutamyl-tRNA(Gln) amidotransferase subunit A